MKRNSAGAPDSGYEEGVAAASYVLNFNNECMLLTHWSALYFNWLSAVEKRMGGLIGEEPVLEDTELAQFTEIIGQLKYHIELTRMQYAAIISHISKGFPANYEQLIRDIRNSYIIKREQLEEYIIILHKFLLEDVIKGLLRSSQQLIDSLYPSE
jgi:hypothetical protein